MQKITPLPTPPTTHDTQSFDIRADAFVEALPQFGEELNSFAMGLNELYTDTEQSLKELEIQARENLAKDREDFKTEVENEKKNAIKEILAQTALQSDQFINIAHHILFTLREIKHKRQRKLEEQNRIGQYTLFFRSSLPQGYVAAGSILKIDEYPLAYLYFKSTSKGLQENCPKGYFRLPRGNTYTKGTSLGSAAGEYEREGLPNVNAGNYVNNSWRYSLNGKGGGSRDDWGCRTTHANFALSAWNSIYGRTNSVEVNHNLLLEGFYVGQRIPP
uniref:hypothetical protein n=1 Tax=Helicobacter typhlonius TaxID=76936 RepID=UPI002FE03DC0